MKNKCKDPYQFKINALKNSTLPVEEIKTEDILVLMNRLSWGIPDERRIVKKLCRLLRERKQLKCLYINE